MMYLQMVAIDNHRAHLAKHLPFIINLSIYNFSIVFCSD